MDTTLKHATILLSALVCLEMLVFSILVLANHGFGNADAPSIMSVSDIAYASIIDDAKIAEDDFAIDDLSITEEVSLSEEQYQPDQWSSSAEDYTLTDNGYTDYDYANYEVGITGNDYSTGYDYQVDNSYLGNYTGGDWVSGSDFRQKGIHYDDSGYSYTYYSENVLPGGGLDIPGRHVDGEGYVCDANGNLCIASDDLPKGTVVDVPFGSGTAVVYDCGSGYGNLDVYVSW